MQLYNIEVPITNDTTADVLFQELPFDKDEHFCYSAQMRDNILRLNCPEEPEYRAYTPRAIVDTFLYQQKKHLNPPIEYFMSAYQSFINKTVNRAYEAFHKIVPDKEEVRSILYLSIAELFSRDYYIHAGIIWKTLKNKICYQHRKDNTYINKGAKVEVFISSLNDEILNEDGDMVTKLDILVDEQASQEAYDLTHYTQEDRKQELIERIKRKALTFMSEQEFNSMLTKIVTKTIDSRTSRYISVLREHFNPDAPPRRPNVNKSSKPQKPIIRSK